jgi:MinD-like ATPase involved in chromosome partitioning or flagellar assembly/CheY-like chemotaxis protein
MEHKLINVLLIEDNPGDTRLIQELFKEAKVVPTRLLCADRLSSGLEMLSKGGVDVVLLDLSLHDSKGLDTFSRVHTHAKELPVIVLTGFDDEDLAMQAVQEGAQDYIAKGSVNSQSLIRAVRFAVERNRKLAAVPNPRSRTSPGKILGFLASKGGAGATTVALNTAAIIAQLPKTVIALELRSYGSSFASQTQQTPARNLRYLLDLEAERITVEEVQKCLVALPSGVNAIFAPQKADEFREIQPAQAEAIIRCAAQLADYVVVDLSSDPCAVTQAAAGKCDHLTLVVERSLSGVAAGARTVQLLRHWGVEERSFSAVIVIQDPLGGFMSPADLETRLGCAIAAVVPPAAELCVHSNRTGTPFVLLEADNIATGSLLALAEKLAEPALITAHSGA